VISPAGGGKEAHELVVRRNRSGACSRFSEPAYCFVLLVATVYKYSGTHNSVLYFASHCADILVKLIDITLGFFEPWTVIVGSEIMWTVAPDLKCS
jgi:hypothetical protein